MRNTAPSDSELLAEWLKHRRESAFHALVVRYAPLVHMAAKRTCGDESLAADASQLVFILLAQKAKSLSSRTSLAGWLHLAAILHAKRLSAKSRNEFRKLEHLHSAMAPLVDSSNVDAWTDLQPVLDAAIASLSENDRETILLRFYRSLSVKEIATTLGIGTDAAQKRLDRATERLREKLTRRGVTTAGSLSAVMLAGYASEAKAAALSTSVLSSKAIAASAVMPISIFATILTMKATPYIAPAVILLCGGLFLNSQSQAILKVRQETAVIRTAIPDYASTLIGDEPSTVTTAKMDWKKFALRMDTEPTQAMVYFGQLRAHLKTLSRDEMIAALDEIETLELLHDTRDLLIDTIVARLSDLDPEYVVHRFAERLCGAERDLQTYWKAFGQWAKKDPLAAQEWLNLQEANGKLVANTIDGEQVSRIQMEAQLLPHLLAHDPAAVTTRLGKLPESRDRVLLWVDVFNTDLKSKTDLANYVRAQLPEANSVNIIGQYAKVLFEYHGGAPVANAYLNHIAATPTERAAFLRCIEERAASQKR